MSSEDEERTPLEQAIAFGRKLLETVKEMEAEKQELQSEKENLEKNLIKLQEEIAAANHKIESWQSLADEKDDLANKVKYLESVCAVFFIASKVTPLVATHCIYARKINA